ncbi:hypothetical protein [Rubritalea tangerina]|uniref:hypothetical protein n=1 Tax=Rubritalea tangerina TaxID=430798 RepID=UPI003622540A
MVGWERGAKLNRGQRLGAASCSTNVVYSVVSNWMEDHTIDADLKFLKLRSKDVLCQVI